MACSDSIINKSMQLDKRDRSLVRHPGGKDVHSKREGR